MSSTEGPQSAVRLTGWDYATWRAATADPIFHAPLVALVRVAGHPGIDELVRRLRRALPGTVLSRRIEVRDGHPYLVECDVDPAAHVREWPADRDLVRDLSRAAAELLPKDGPPWTMLVQPAPGDGALLGLVMDHAVADGRAALALAAGLLDGWSPPEPRSPRAGEPQANGPRGGLRAGIESALAVTRSVVRLTRVHDRPLSPLFTDRGPDQDWALFEFPLMPLRDAARAAGVTVNDAFVAAVLRGVAAHHTEQGVGVDRLRVNVPISLRDRSAVGGNALAVARATLPVPRDASGLLELHEVLLGWRSEPALAHVDRLAEASRLLPPSVMAAVARSSDLTVSNLGLVPGTARIAGHRVEAVFPLPATMGVALSVALLTYGETGCVGLAVDTSAVADPEGLVGQVRTAVRG